MEQAESRPIDWALFESKYWRPEEGQTHYVTVAGWRMSHQTFDDSKTEKPILVFEVLEVDNRKYNPPKLFTTGSLGFAEQIKPIIEKAEHEGRISVTLYMEYTKEKKYRLMDIDRVRGFIDRK